MTDTFHFVAAASETPGYEPGVGNRITNKIRLHPAKTWDEGNADKFKTAGYDDLFSKKKVHKCSGFFSLNVVQGLS